MQTSEFRVMRSFDIHYFILVVPDAGFLGRETPVRQVMSDTEMAAKNKRALIE